MTSLPQVRHSTLLTHLENIPSLNSSRNEDFIWWPDYSSKVSATWHTWTSISQPLWKSRTVFLSQNKPSLLNFIFTRLQYHCYYFSSLLSIRPPFKSTVLKMNFPFPPSLYRLDTPQQPLAPALSSLAGSGCRGRSYYFKLLKLVNFARVNHFAFLLLQLEASWNLPFSR